MASEELSLDWVRRESAAERALVEHPGKDDIHEQRESAQEVEGIVHEPTDARARATL